MARLQISALMVVLSAVGMPAVDGECSGKFQPPSVPMRANDHNGVVLDSVCFEGKGPHHVFLIGDWGGVADPVGTPVKPAWQGARQLSAPIDVNPQQRVAKQMLTRATNGSWPNYVLNVGDSFYWGGIDAMCGSPPFQYVETGKFADDFESMYSGKGLDGIPWLGVLGNHDYGGFHFTAAWDQIIGYTWERPPPWSGRWIMPAQYWSVSVNYPIAAPKAFSVDYFFLDSNVFDASDPHLDPEHNICSSKHNPPGASCGPQGPLSLSDCPGWFENLWKEQSTWVEDLLARSKADWQVIVTHFPPTYGAEYWEDIAQKYGIDLIVSGHHHNQNVHYQEKLLGPTAWIVSGGGGGILSESKPHEEGKDDQYGFVDITFTQMVITIDAISHGGLIRSTTEVMPRAPGQGNSFANSASDAWALGPPSAPAPAPASGQFI